MRNTVLATAVAATLALAAPTASAAGRRARHQGRGSGHAGADAGAGRAPEQARGGQRHAAGRERPAKAIVERRDAETDYLKAQTKELREEGAVASNEITKVKGADWATKIKFKGDLRYPRRE